MNEKIIILPNRKEMLLRLLGVSKKECAQKQFYPTLLEHAGQEFVVGGVVMMLVLAIQDYVKGVSFDMANLLYMHMPRFIEALVGNGEDFERVEISLREALVAK